ncbi:hypothetical protein HLI_20580 [Halobacillus litoralis]|uniref:Restriction endonuclease type IV Mrr domain-containing protein n=1 Tax=Halobacillus litoralis TaxID=45668 RepID=A0A410MIC5_9BACI|nr:hypothetical protein HLI_20580 [Halobacillus litoralis]
MLSLLFHLGYGQTKENVKSNVRKTNDWGLDGYIELDPLGLDKLYIQARRWNQNSVALNTSNDFQVQLIPKVATKESLLPLLHLLEMLRIVVKKLRTIHCCYLMDSI